MRGKIRSFEYLFEKMCEESYKKYGFANAKLAKAWPEIVGSSLAQISAPEKIVYEGFKKTDGTLYILLANPAFSLQIQALERNIIEKIRIYFGYKAAAKIRIKVGSNIKLPQLNIQKQNDTKEKQITPSLAALDDSDLKSALIDLYNALG